MFVTFLKFAANRAAAPEFMAAHNDWIAKGFADGVFLCVGSLTPAAGGAVLAHGESREAHEARIAADPFVAQGIVTAETHEIDMKRTIPALDFLGATA
ncbi:YciI family protein [Roseinatronobacter sp. S2]|uniref:YciI family protein n=1 Tax=Roseinatronobacter sp. S2 TaxID=3035471 RepID=UPI00240F7889|nr:YciI family protein [Roseinatronobacter sp. S2]WFE73976.1 YciI family protein [Roseinatronobacter sp. S2]